MTNTPGGTIGHEKLVTGPHDTGSCHRTLTTRYTTKPQTVVRARERYVTTEEATGCVAVLCTSAGQASIQITSRTHTNDMVGQVELDESGESGCIKQHTIIHEHWDICREATAGKKAESNATPPVRRQAKRRMYGYA